MAHIFKKIFVPFYPRKKYRVLMTRLDSAHIRLLTRYHQTLKLVFQGALKDDLPKGSLAPNFGEVRL